MELSVGRGRLGQELVRRRRSSLLSALLVHPRLVTGPQCSLSRLPPLYKTNSADSMSASFVFVGRGRLELPTLAGPAPKAGAYTNSAIYPSSLLFDNDTALCYSNPYQRFALYCLEHIVSRPSQSRIVRARFSRRRITPSAASLLSRAEDNTCITNIVRPAEAAAVEIAEEELPFRAIAHPSAKRDSTSIPRALSTKQS